MADLLAFVIFGLLSFVIVLRVMRGRAPRLYAYAWLWLWPLSAALLALTGHPGLAALAGAWWVVNLLAFGLLASVAQQSANRARDAVGSQEQAHVRKIINDAVAAAQKGRV